MTAAQHALRQKQMHILQRAAYWTFGGVYDAAHAAKRAWKYAHAESIEFFNSAALLAIGSWIIAAAITGRLELPIFNDIPSALIRGALGLVLVGIGRYGLHCMLSHIVKTRLLGLFITLHAWVALAVSCYLFGRGGFMTTAFLVCAGINSLLFWVIRDHDKKASDKCAQMF